MRFLVIAQDLRVSGTSAGIVTRSLIVKLRMAYPEAIIDVCYIIHRDTEDALDLLPVNSVNKHIVNNIRPFYVTFINWFYWRLFHVSLNERYIQKQYGKFIASINHDSYDHILITSSGTEHESILATHNLPILKRATLIFHDPYPLAWYVGANKTPSKLDLFRLKQVMEVVEQSKSCASTAKFMSHDLQHLFASKKKFHTLPHQFDTSVFDMSDESQVRKKQKKISISYHGALMYGRNLMNLLLAYECIIQENSEYKELTEFIIRAKGDGLKDLKSRFKGVSNIHILETIGFSNSSYEQVHESDIVIILENGPYYCNILVGKSAFLANYHKPVLCVSPEKSELRNIITDDKFIADMNDLDDLKVKLLNLIKDRINSNQPVNPFGDYFSDDNFKKALNIMLS
ncbi:hypothetical protein Q4566_00945 [Tamlana sp. 2_MG-2023]|uniref:hypothetical protein n=1 Tax=unclassified Tamlana TaxID=2614803 RepID=UPI0026E2AAD0|nr:MULTISPECIES: hypothetical protein [unclassified Tamlana]MDO6758750.1 hypothetical protein [Tamlana sp. 2_MG-2023]MDO6789449.1 hypothetical protein [Tamlana sp. 1_MG-2023]